MAECASCHARIMWCVTSKGASMPVDADPVVDGNLIFDGSARSRSGAMVPRVLVLAGGDVPLGDPPRYRSHLVTCPRRAA